MASAKACACKAVPAAAAAAFAAVAAMPGTVPPPPGPQLSPNIGGVGSNIEGTGGANDLYAPDVFVVNGTGHDVALSVRLPLPGTHDVVPAWDGGTWTALSRPDGSLIVAGQRVPYLHYELQTTARWQTATGWSIQRSALRSWALTVLPAYGFSPAAVAAFQRTWSSLAEGSGQLYLYPQTGITLDSTEPLTVSGAAATVRRVWFLVDTPGAGGAAPVPPVPEAPPAGPIDVQEWGLVFGPDVAVPPIHEWWEAEP